MSEEKWKAYARGMAAAMKQGGVFVPAQLLRSYKRLGLTEQEAMLMLQIMVYDDAEHNGFPTTEELAERMGATERQVAGWLGKLIKEGLLSIDDYIEAGTGVQAERYNWSGWLLKAAETYAEEAKSSKSAGAPPESRRTREAAADLFSVFEQEFGRLLSPFECETISGWLDQDRYSEEVIRFALKEAVFAGKLSLKYIDRILLEWSRNRVTTEEEARAHSQKFFGGRG